MIVKGGQAVVRSLIDEGVTYVFGIPGVHSLPIYDAMYDAPELTHILARHEEGAAFMADGYARASGKQGVCITSAGPGATNTVTAVSEAFLDSSPVILIAGGIPRQFRGRGGFHDVRQMEIFTEVTKWQASIDSVEEIPQIVHEAFVRAINGRPRPVFLEFPLDVLASEGTYAERRLIRIKPARISDPLIEDTVKIVLEAERPIIVAGAGVMSPQVTAELMEMAQLLRAPVATTVAAKGAVSEDNELSLGLLNDEVAFTIISQSDAVLALGCSFSEYSTNSWRLKVPENLIHVDIDPSEIGKIYPAKVAVVAPVKEFLQALLPRLRSKIGVPPSRKDWLRIIAALKEKRWPDHREKMISDASPIKPQRVVKEIAKIMDKDTIIVADSGNSLWWPIVFLNALAPRSIFGPTGNATMGFALPAAIGARCARPEAKVIAVAGDGGFLMTCMELATAAAHRVKVTIVIMNDEGYGSIRHIQKFSYGGRHIAVDFPPPDFVKFAEAFGVKGLSVSRPGEIGAALEEGLEHDGPALIDVHIDREETVLPSALVKGLT